MRTGKILLTTTWIGAIAAVVALGNTFEQASQQFFGITDNREQVISFPHPVEIVEARVVEGERVVPGTVLLSLRRPDLQAEEAVLEHQIAEIEASHHEATVALEGESARVEQDLKVRSAELDTQIAELEQRHGNELAVLRSISGSRVAERANSDSPAMARLTGLRNERRRVAEAAASRIESIQQRLAASVAPERARLAELRSRRQELQRQQARLNVVASAAGRVGSVLFRPGDVVPAFASIITLHGAAPELVKGYIHEDVINEVSVGREVWVRSMAAGQQLLTGTVESLGSRIVAYPDRLLKNRGVPAWGREVVIRLDDGNRLLLGEKVSISLQRPKPMQAQIAALFNSGMRSVFGIGDAIACNGGCGDADAGNLPEAAGKQTLAR